jgi:hypothetical protein
VDAIQLIQREHRNIEQLFKSFERAEDDVEVRGRLAREIVRELSLHAAIEEQLLYPALRNAGLRRDVLDALEEHHAAKVTLAEIDAMPASGERFASKMGVLFTSVRAHIEEEEAELLPGLERALDVRARQELGDSLEHARRAAPTRPHPTAPDTPPGNLIANAMAAIADRARDAARGGLDMLSVLAERTVDSGIRLARTLLGRGRERAWRAGADLRESGREGLAQARELPREIAAQLDERREQGRRALQGSAYGAARALDNGAGQRRRGKARRTGTQRRIVKPRKRATGEQSTGAHRPTTH